MPSNIALTDGNARFSYKELDVVIDRFSFQLHSLGVKEGSRVAFVAESNWQCVAVFFALFRLKAIACPLMKRLPSLQIKKYLETLDATCFIDPPSLGSGPL
ncbi:MAG: AMP-binding protein, partial [Anaerolineae bacterium]